MRNIVLFSISKFISALGHSVYSFGIGLFVLKMTGSASSFAITLICSALPRIIFGSLAGVWADRFSHKALIVGSQSAAALLLLGVFFLPLSVPLLYGTAALLAVCGTITNVTFTSSLANLVERDELQRATSINSSVSSISLLLGPVVGGLLYGYFTVETFILLNAVAYSIAAVLESLLRFKPRDVAPTASRGMVAEMTEAWQFVKQHEMLRLLLPVAIWLNFFTTAFTVGLPFITVQKLQLSATQFGTIEAMFAGGMLIASIALSVRSEMRQPMMVIKRCLLLVALGLAAPAVPLLFHFTPLAAFSYFIGLLLSFGATIVTLNTPISVILQKTTPEPFRGRVFGLLDTLASCITPIGMALFGMIFDYVSPTIVMLATSGLLLAFLVYQLRPAKMAAAVEGLKAS